MTEKNNSLISNISSVLERYSAISTFINISSLYTQVSNLTFGAVSTFFDWNEFYYKNIKNDLSDFFDNDNLLKIDSISSEYDINNKLFDIIDCTLLTKPELSDIKIGDNLSISSIINGFNSSAENNIGTFILSSFLSTANIRNSVYKSSIYINDETSAITIKSNPVSAYLNEYAIADLNAKLYFSELSDLTAYNDVLAISENSSKISSGKIITTDAFNDLYLKIVENSITNIINNLSCVFDNDIFIMTPDYFKTKVSIGLSTFKSDFDNNDWCFCASGLSSENIGVWCIDTSISAQPYRNYNHCINGSHKTKINNGISGKNFPPNYPFAGYQFCKGTSFKINDSFSTNSVSAAINAKRENPDTEVVWNEYDIDNARVGLSSDTIDGTTFYYTNHKLSAIGLQDRCNHTVSIYSNNNSATKYFYQFNVLSIENISSDENFEISSMLSNDFYNYSLHFNTDIKVGVDWINNYAPNNDFKSPRRDSTGNIQIFIKIFNGETDVTDKVLVFGENNNKLSVVNIESTESTENIELPDNLSAKNGDWFYIIGGHYKDGSLNSVAYSSIAANRHFIIRGLTGNIKNLKIVLFCKSGNNTPPIHWLYYMGATAFDGYVKKPINNEI